MERVALDGEIMEGLTEIALSIFVDCSNAGTSFQDSLLSIYLSGLEHGASLMKEEEDISS